MNSEQADILDLLSGHTDDTTIERLAFECLLTNMTDDRVVSLMNILGWQGDFNCFAIAGCLRPVLPRHPLAIRKAVRDLGGEHVVIARTALSCWLWLARWARGHAGGDLYRGHAGVQRGRATVFEPGPFRCGGGFACVA